jgi:chromosome segregation ATPase
MAEHTIAEIKTEVQGIKDRMTTIEPQLAQIKKDISSIERLVTILLENSNEDRKDIGKTHVSMATIAETQRQILNENDKQEKRIINGVADKVAVDVPHRAQEGVRRAFEKIKPKTVQIKIQRQAWNPFRLFGAWG